MSENTVHQIACPSCGVMQPEGSRFCDNCGTEMPVLPPMPVCTGCGNVLKKGAHFCGVCGHAVPVPAPVEEPVPVIAPVPTPKVTAPIKGKKKKSKAGIVIALLLVPLVLLIVAAILVFALLPKAPESVELSVEQVRLECGQVMELEHSVKPWLLFNKDVQWESSDPAVVTVEDGMLTAVGEGSCTVSVTTANGKTDSCTVMVAVKAVQQLEFSLSQMTMELGQTVEPAYRVFPEDAGSRLSWHSDRSDVVEVKKPGELTAVGIGECTVTVTADNGISASCTVTVTTSPEAEQVTGTWTLIRIEERYNDTVRNASGSTLVLNGDQTGSGKLDGEELTFRWFFSKEDSEGDYWFYLETEDAEIIELYYSVLGDELCIYGEDESWFLKRK